jgi:hypothetical protein
MTLFLPQLFVERILLWFASITTVSSAHSTALSIRKRKLFLTLAQDKEVTLPNGKLKASIESSPWNPILNIMPS